MSKETFKKLLEARYPNRPEKVYDLAWILQSMDKALMYAEKLSHCTDYHQLAELVVDMHDKEPKSIYRERTTREKGFLDILIPLCCMEEGAKAHAAKHHVSIKMDQYYKEKNKKKEQEIVNLLCTELDVDSEDDMINVVIKGRWPKKIWMQLMENGKDVTIKNIDE